nr:hypothetical protein [Tanacetum cinerariifolium]
WDEFKTMLTTEYCPDTEVHKMEIELWKLTLKGDDVDSYTNRFHELILMCPGMVYAAAPVGPTDRKSYTGTLPYCSKCDWHHTGACAKLCK